MNDGPQQRPEGYLLQTAMKRKNMSAKKLADQVGLSDAWVRNVVNGYQPIGKGQRIEIIGPEDTIARLAAELDVTPEELEAADRYDAADALRRRLPGGPMPEWAGSDDSPIWREVVAISEEIREWAEDPHNYLPPASILSYFGTHELTAEIQARVSRAEKQIGRYYWQVEPSLDLVAATLEKEGGTSDVDSDAAQKMTGDGGGEDEGGGNVTPINPTKPSQGPASVDLSQEPSAAAPKRQDRGQGDDDA